MARRFAAHLSVAAGAAVLLVGLGGTAKAAEERLYSSSLKIFGLIPAFEGSKSATSGDSIRTASADISTGTTTMKSGAKRSSSGAGNEPQIEDPPMPTYDGPAGGGSEAAGPSSLAN